MNKKYKHILTFSLIMIVIMSVLLIVSIYNQKQFIDENETASNAKIIYILVTAFLLASSIFSILIILIKNHKKTTKKAMRMSHKTKKVGPIKNELIAKYQKEDKNIVKEDTNKSSLETSSDNRFSMLCKIDEEIENSGPMSFEDETTLSQICEEFRLYSADKLKLYYDIEDIRRFIAGLSVTRIIILQGMSGTGKTSLAYAFGKYLKNDTTVVPIQPMWKERTDLIGYYNEFTRKFNETTLLQKIYEANYLDKIYITVLDEMNIARIEYYFAEFLSLLELPDYNKRYLDVVSDEWNTDPKLLQKGRIILPKNMWFIGTANNDDSTFAISDKVYDRAMVLNLDKKATPFRVKESNQRMLSETKFEELIKKAQKVYKITERNLRRIKTIDKYLTDKYQITFGNRIMQQIKNYVPVMIACGGSELGAIDDILSKKVLRKLETKNMVYVKSTIPDLISFIEELFGEEEMLLCKEYIKQIEINA
ncbi:conserved hypothetical protein [Alteracholeplasma palmae J233]|uniref:ATPase dynein-related AAA domain-containing protein n=1 Tax=Alteracholeplasma palmae (strain ATCC 49389 / J233) TaxID=1318466 RepID=U4KL15_ALTPJ|nr:AAA family ATPase [Alteracholeplasma palmae]CCV64408.1 conserved hypothetical protein [Alteracholeplasma palmae J233]